MTGLVRRAALFCAMGLATASVVMAGVPSATTSTQPLPPGGGTHYVLKLTGHGSPPDPGPPAQPATVSYVVRDGASNPVPGSTVIFNFAACPDIRICLADQTFPGPPSSVNCAAKTVFATTNGVGQLSIVIAGASNAASGSGYGTTLKGCVKVTADGNQFSDLSAVAPDYDGRMTGASGVAYDGIDGGLFKSDLDAFPGSFHQRSNYDSDSDVDGIDGGAFKAFLDQAAGGSPKACGYTGPGSLSGLCP